MSSEEFNEIDPLESLLDQQSDADFGEAELREHLDENSKPLVLRNWTAQDFSNIYIRFYPHVLRQAKRYLTNHSQAEEVTQDAFLYLMTSLPEVDSEIGVLKLLKWKVRLLALDVIGANGQARFAPIDNQHELSIDDSELSLQLERADDAAIVAMALAKLEPRQREALVASLYEEKSTSEVAGMLQLNENATKQLLFRAKTAFKKALVGEAETRGMSLPQILSVAARKARQESGKYVSAASALLLVLAVSIGILPNLADSPSELVAEAPAAVPGDQDGLVLSGEPDPETPLVGDSPIDSEPTGSGEVAEATTVQDSKPEENLEPDSTVSSPSTSPSPLPQQDVPVAGSNIVLTGREDLSPFDPWLLDPILEQGVITTSLLSGGVSAVTAEPELLTIVSDEGVWVDLVLQQNSRTPFQRVSLGVGFSGENYFSEVRQTDLLVLSSAAESETYVFVGQIGTIRDSSGQSFTQTRLDGTQLRVSITLNPKTGIVTATTLSLVES